MSFISLQQSKQPAVLGVGWAAGCGQTLPWTPLELSLSLSLCSGLLNPSLPPDTPTTNDLSRSGLNVCPKSCCSRGPFLTAQPDVMGRGIAFTEFQASLRRKGTDSQEIPACAPSAWQHGSLNKCVLIDGPTVCGIAITFILGGKRECMFSL